MSPDEKIAYRAVTVRTVEGTTLTGKVNLSGVYDRVSDLFTRDEKPFIVLVDVKGRDGGTKTLIINKIHIVWVEPHDESDPEIV